MAYYKRIRQIREAHRNSVDEICALLKKSRKAYERIESGETEIKMHEMIVLCEFYNISMDYFGELCDTPRKLK